MNIIATVGPKSLNQDVLGKFRERGVDAIRLNLSHTDMKDIEPCLAMMKASGIEMIVDTEGSQIRTGHLGQPYLYFNEGDPVRVFDRFILCGKDQIYLRPRETFDFLNVGSLLSIDFNSVLLKVIYKKNREYVDCVVLNGGVIGNNKAVSIDTVYTLPAFTEKDIFALKLAKKYDIKYFTLSYIGSDKEVKFFKELYPEAILYSKIETKKGVENFEKILNSSHGILIDRGDLGREISIEKIPFIQKIIIRRCRKVKKPVFIATHLLESMCASLKPTRSEVNDITSTLLDGANGFVLTKETAVGRYPVETVNTLKSLIRHTHLMMNNSSLDSSVRLSDMNYVTNEIMGDSLIEPNGGRLIDRYKLYEFGAQELDSFKKIYVDDTVLMDVEQIALGAFSPLEGFVNSDELEMILNEMRLPNKVPWPLPLVLPVDEGDARNIKEKEMVALVRKRDKKIYATVLVEEVYKVDKFKICKKWFGTDRVDHPGVFHLISRGDYFIGGKINLLERVPTPHKHYELTPLQTRRIFKEKGWSVIIGFHTRNPIHRAHEYIQRRALEEIRGDGLFVHPVVGQKKKGDFETDIIVKSYEIMMKNYYPKKKVLMGAFWTYPRYGGPREALFSALCRQNFGCSHFIVGRDHTGVNQFYHHLASHEIFGKFPDLKIKPVFFDEVFYSKKHRKYFIKSGKNSARKTICSSMSGTYLKQTLSENKMPPIWLMRPKIAKMIFDQKENSSKKVFVE